VGEVMGCVSPPSTVHHTHVTQTTRTNLPRPLFFILLSISSIMNLTLHSIYLRLLDLFQSPGPHFHNPSDMSSPSPPSQESASIKSPNPDPARDVKRESPDLRVLTVADPYPRYEFGDISIVCKYGVTLKVDVSVLKNTWPYVLLPGCLEESTNHPGRSILEPIPLREGRGRPTASTSPAGLLWPRFSSTYALALRVLRPPALTSRPFTSSS
jgi:hypothetical protein